MLQRKELLLFFLFMVLVIPAIARDIQIKANSNDTITNGITQDETILFNMINDMRRQNKLPSIPLSPDLCKVAHVHIADLIKWKPQDKGCSLHSWSGSGKWTACCNTKEVFGIQCMKSKPREITGYKGDGYELIYWGEDKATPAEAAELWKQVDASSDMILGRAKWTGYNWTALGVGIKEGYAILWLGDSVNTMAPNKLPENIPVVKKTASKAAPVAKSPVVQKDVAKPEPPAKQKTEASAKVTYKDLMSASGTKFYIIAGSFKTAEAAKTELLKIRSKGYPAAFILEGEANFRIALASFDTKDKAEIVKNELKETFPGIWVYKK